ncbi:MAG: biotin--[acetyl-CoA-carboxylase] ligase, partial [Lachnospiraceae bacterium]|nr:biotin--[acetyl-CoA-carboxylase] ligase [Lachnospiraceae bacterium]
RILWSINMSIKDDVLKILEKNRGTYISGEEIARQLSVSRTAVWKAVKALNNEGYGITGINKLGYGLTGEDDVISVDGIQRYLPEAIKDLIEITVLKSVTSTNTMLKQKAAEGEREWSVLIAEEQTAGKGRMNRNFYSPSDSGIYMSILLRPDFNVSESLFITTMAAAAVAQSIERVLQKETKIKWVNDVYLKDKKVCGILTEASVNVETSRLDYAVLGIGINVKPPQKDFPEEIKQVAGSLMEQDSYHKIGDNIRNRLISEIIATIYKYYVRLDRHEFMSIYKEKSMLIGKEVYILSDKNKEGLFVLDIDDNAALVVEHKDGRIEHLSSGEVSVRIK